MSNLTLGQALDLLLDPSSQFNTPQALYDLAA